MRKLGLFLMRLGIAIGITAGVTMFRSHTSGLGWRESPTLWTLVLMASLVLATVGWIVSFLAGDETGDTHRRP
jgi:hypothetical protein